MPYRIDLGDGGDEVFDRLVELGALDVESLGARGIAALMPDADDPAEIANVLGVADIAVSPATGRDADSVWILRPRPVTAAGIRIVPADVEAQTGDLRLIDAAAFGTGLHPTTALCLNALEEAIQATIPTAVLDVGTGSGVLALAALMMGVPRATALDIDDESLRVAAENARINGMRERLQLTRGGPEVVDGTWPLVVANILAASLIEMAPTLVRRVGHHGRLVLSGIPVSLDDEVARVYHRFGMRSIDVKANAGWVALVLQASW